MCADPRTLCPLSYPGPTIQNTIQYKITCSILYDTRQEAVSAVPLVLTNAMTPAGSSRLTEFKTVCYHPGISAVTSF